MVSVNNSILYDCFNLYGDQSLYNKYSEIANKYNELYEKNKDNKKLIKNLKKNVKKWFFSQSLESRLKICTVENEYFGKFLCQMFEYFKMDNSVQFKPKSCFFNEDDNETEFTKKISNLDNFSSKTNDCSIYPSNNTNIKITKTNKSGKKTDAPKLGYSQSSLKDFSKEEIGSNNFGNYFYFQSYRSNFSLENDKAKDKMDDIIKLTEDLFSNIIYFSVHHKYFPDCFTLSPVFLLEKEKFENAFNFGNQKCFSFLIQSEQIDNNNNKNKKQCIYRFPEWLKSDIFYNIPQYIIAFFEQVIMIKYLLYKDKETKVYSLLDEDALNQFFIDRKLAINYIKTSYTSDNKLNIINELDIKTGYNNLISNNNKMKYVNLYKNNRKKLNWEKLKNNPYTIDSINNNPYSNKCEEKYYKINKITKPKSNNYKDELTSEEIIDKLKKLLQNDNILFIDYLLFQNYNCLWKLEYFLQAELFEKLNKLRSDKSYEELIFDSKQTKSNEPKHKKKKKKNNKNNENKITETPKQDEKTKTQDEYFGIFKDEEEELYAPYYLEANTKQKELYEEIKGKINNSNNVIDPKEKEKEIQEIKQFISKEIILELIIDKVFLIPLNNCLDFYEKFNNENNINYKKNEKENDDEKEQKEISEININSSFNKEEKNVNVIKQEKEEEINNNNDNNSNDKMDNDINCKEVSDNNISKENDFENKDSLSLKSDAISSEIEKNNIITSTTNDSINNNIHDSDKKEKEINNNSNKKNSNNSNQKKKKEKEQTFFLFDTVKKKKKKTTNNMNKSNNTSNEFNIITIKEPNTRIPFFDKLHNDIIKYETKVVTLLNHGMKFKDYCITEIKRLIQETFTFSNDYSIDVYGSHATGLMIEASDIDIKIKLNSGNKADLNNLFEMLCKKLENENKFDEINPIGTASVPVIKLLLSLEKYIKGKEDLENSFKQFKELSLFKHYLFDINELIKVKIDVTFILINNSDKNNNIISNGISEKKSNDEINENNSDNNINESNKKNNNEKMHDHDQSISGEISSVSYVKEQIKKYPEIKYIIRVLKRYFYYKKMNSSFFGGLSSYNLFLLLLSYAKYIRISQNADIDQIFKDDKDKNKVNLGYFLFHFLYFFNYLNFKQYVIDINSENIYDVVKPEKAKELNFGKSIVIIDPLTGVNASKSSYKIDEIQGTFSEALDFFQKEERNYDKEGKTKVSKNNNKNNDNILMGLPINNKSDSHGGGGGNIIEKFLGK